MILNPVGPRNSQPRSAAPVVTDTTVPLSDFASYTVIIETGKFVDQHLFHDNFINIVDHAGVPPMDETFKDPSATSKLQNLVDNAAALPTEEQLKTIVENINDFQMDIGDVSQQDKSTFVHEKDGRNQLCEEMDSSPDQDQIYKIAMVRKKQEPSLHTLIQALLSLICKLFVLQTSELGKLYFYIFNWLTSSKMWRMQLIGPNRPLIKLTQLPPVFTQSNDGGEVQQGGEARTQKC
ncbi:hypothetical protein BJV82DRAFT_575283 [Fennellomyces sp. T-0311]|nr:hypothetical protein BJV82DRAFT_575283 [Fennellomyces sp. T-0311]